MNQRIEVVKSVAGLLALACCLAPHSGQGSDFSEWQTKMQPIAPRSYLCERAAQPITVDGKLDEADWSKAPWTEDFVDIQGPSRATPRFRTRAKLLWDDQYLYIAAELEEPHIWATQTNHDSVIFQDPDFEVFIDPKGETQPYYEFEMNALNTTWDLLLDKPYMDGGKAHNEWEIPGTQTAVALKGTLNNPADQDLGWTVELAFPWKGLEQHARHAGPPRDGEQWHIDFSRVEWQITTTNGTYQKVPNHPEDNWVWSPPGVIDMHRPDMWGLVQFSTNASPVNTLRAASKAARDSVLGVYYAQRDFWKAHHEWATNLSQLSSMGWTPGVQVSGDKELKLRPTSDGYTVEAHYNEDHQEHVWRCRQDRLLKHDQAMPVESEAFISQAAQEFSDAGRRAAFFLVDNMPASDRGTLSCEFLMENLRLAFQARKSFPWAGRVPEPIFLNDVLPYASVDEPRDFWRPQFLQMAGELVRDCKTGAEAAQVLNRDFFKKINVHYNLGRTRNNQGPLGSISEGKATCTGLAILLVDACRAVGVPARIVGVPEWADKQGNHTWVEIWDGEWFFTGADEYDAKGLNRGWFNNDAALTARSSNPLNQIYASSWRRTGDYFRLAWDPESRAVNAVNVSGRYAALPISKNPTETVVHVRLREKANGQRMVADVQLRSGEDKLLAADKTRGWTADLNDMPDFTLPKNAARLTFRFVHEQEAREKTIECASCAANHTLDFAWDELSPVPAGLLTAESWLARPRAERQASPSVNLASNEVFRIQGLLWADLQTERGPVADAELAAKEIVIGDKRLKWMERTFGEAADGEHSLWITLHGGGQGTPEENDQNWRGYYGRYEFPPGSINVAPRAPANSWDLWHIPVVDGLLDRLISDMVLRRGVNPNRVFLIGYSAGGDGVYQLAPRMADRFAAAGMCAGHPNAVTPEGLRNLPFFLYMGGEDGAYHRNEVVRTFSASMDKFREADPEGYPHRLTVYAGLGHNMQGREAEMIPRMVPLRRQPWPSRVVWKENDGVIHHRFYWLERPADSADPNTVYAAHVDGQTITIESPGSGHLIVRLSDKLLNLDEPIKVIAQGHTIFEGKVQRSLSTLFQSLQERADRDSAAAATLDVHWAP